MEPLPIYGKYAVVTGLSLQGAYAVNYMTTTAMSTTADVIPRDITVNADAKTIIYGDTPRLYYFEATAYSKNLIKNPIETNLKRHYWHYQIIKFVHFQHLT